MKTAKEDKINLERGCITLELLKLCALSAFKRENNSINGPRHSEDLRYRPVSLDGETWCGKGGWNLYYGKKALLYGRWKEILLSLFEPTGLVSESKEVMGEREELYYLCYDLGLDEVIFQQINDPAGYNLPSDQQVDLYTHGSDVKSLVSAQFLGKVVRLIKTRELTIIGVSEEERS